MSHCNSAVTHLVPDLSEFCGFSMLHQRYAKRSRQMLEHSRIITTFRGVICQGTCVHSGSQCSIWQAPRVSELMSWVFLRCIRCYSMCVDFSQPPILASIKSVVESRCSHLAWGIRLFQPTWQGIHHSWCTWQHPKSHHRTHILHLNINHWSHLSWAPHGAPRIASSSTMCNFLQYFSCYSIALNVIFTTYTLSPTFPNFLSSLQQMEPMPSQVTNHYSQKNQEAHLERALAFKKAANRHFPPNVGLPISAVVLCIADD